MTETATDLAEIEPEAGVHLWPLGSPITDDSRCTRCGCTRGTHYHRPACGPEDPAGRAEHVDPKSWSKQTILGHMAQAHGGTYITARTTKQMEVELHADFHEQEDWAEAMFVRRWADGTVADLRKGYGCRLTDGDFASVDDEWLAEHLGYHETGNDLGGLLV